VTSASPSATGHRPAPGSADSTVQVFAPHRASLPPLVPYLRSFTRRLRFAYELARTQEKATHFDSPLGALWLVLNPMLLGIVYFLLVSVLSGGKGDWVYNLGRILIGIFTWYYAQNAISFGAVSVINAGGLVLNTAFPRALLPLSSTISAAIMYLPTIPVYLVYFLIGSSLDDRTPHLPGLNMAMLWLPVMFVIMSVEVYGLAMLFATMTVYFRDTNKFLGYGLRIWLYLTPVLIPWAAFENHMWAIYLNPLGPIIGGITRIWTEGVPPEPQVLAAAVIWAVVSLVVGGWVFISRERDFAVRI
jgi:teichoic acid transport system permease protein